MSCKQAPFSIDFIIVGAGVTGLATALRLRQSGHRVTVVDKGIGPSEVCLLHHRSIVIPVLQLHLLRPREKVLLIFHPIPPSFSSNGVLENN
jgi:choline dehydrogenase-like flavoprotein